MLTICLIKGFVNVNITFAHEKSILFGVENDFSMLLID